MECLGTFSVAVRTNIGEFRDKVMAQSREVPRNEGTCMQRLTAKAIAAVLKRAGRTYRIDPAIDGSTLRNEFVYRISQLMRGLLRMRRRVFIGRRVRLRSKSRIDAGQYSAIGDYSFVDAAAIMGVRLGTASKLGRFVTVTSTSHLSKRGMGFSLGDGSGIGDFAHIGCSGGVFIGRDVIIGPYCTFHSQEHVYTELDIPIREQGTREAAIKIGDNVWVGARATFLAGVEVGSGSIVAAGSVVRSSFPANSIIGGVPAKLLKTRTATRDVANARTARGVSDG